MPGGRPDTYPEREAEILQVLADVEAGDSEFTSTAAHDIPYSTWKDWKTEHQELSARVHRARAIGNQRLRRELLDEGKWMTKNDKEFYHSGDPVRAKTRAHMLACRDKEWRAEKRVHLSGGLTLSELAIAAASTVAGEEPEEEAED